MDIAAAVEQRETQEARRADLDRRDAEHGGMVSIPAMVAEQQRAESLRGWLGAYRAETSPAEVAALVAETAELETRQERLDAARRRDGRRVEVGRLWIDCGRAVARWAPAFKRDAAETLQGDALLLLLRWERQGGGTDPRSGKRTAPIDLGGDGGTPLRRDWIETVEREDGRLEQQLTALAWRALHAAVGQAAETPEALRVAGLKRERIERADGRRATRIVADDAETATDPVDIAAMVEQEQRDSDAPTRLPDNLAPELLAELLDVSLDAGRAIVAQAYPSATRRDLSEAWSMAPQSVSNALQRGADAVRRRFPDGADLLDALEQCAPRYWRRVETDAAMALLSYREARIGQHIERARRAALQEPTRARRILAWIDRAEQWAPAAMRAETAAADWRTISGSAPMERRALNLAALRAARLYGIPVERAERIANSLPRLLAAEQRRARRQAGATAPMRRDATSPALPLPRNGATAPETRQARTWSYGLAARDDRAVRDIGAAEIVSRNGGQRVAASSPWNTRDPYPLGATRSGAATGQRARVKVPSREQRRAALNAARPGAHRRGARPGAHGQVSTRAEQG